jgi:UDP-N-acetyl-2-amino-2-deoxyglucuronate dehydrogenase
MTSSAPVSDAAGRRLRVGMIGVGGVAANYRAVYSSYDRATLAAVFDIDAELASRVASELGAQAMASADELIAADIDAVVINTPNFLHFAQTAAALRAGKAVLLQKPMTVTAAEALELTQIAEQTGSRLGMYMNSLDNRLMRDFKRMVETGFFGRIGAINAKLANGRGMSFKTSDGATWRGSRQATGGGSFTMLATHYINLAQWLANEPFVSATAMADNLMSGHIEGDDIMASILQFRSGALGIIESSWCVRGEQMSIHGSEGNAAYIDNSVLTLVGNSTFEGDVVKYTTPGQRIVVEGVRPPAMGEWENPFNQHRQFVDAILDGTPLPVPALRGLQDMRSVEAAYQSAQTGQRVAIDAVWAE